MCETFFLHVEWLLLQFCSWRTVKAPKSLLIWLCYPMGFCKLDPNSVPLMYLYVPGLHEVHKAEIPPSSQNDLVSSLYSFEFEILQFSNFFPDDSVAIFKKDIVASYKPTFSIFLGRCARLSGNVRQNSREHSRDFRSSRSCCFKIPAEAEEEQAPAVRPPVTSRLHLHLCAL